MPNLSQIKRQRMLDFLETLKKEHTDDESICAFTEIENQLRDKKYGLVWEGTSPHGGKNEILKTDRRSSSGGVDDGRYGLRFYRMRRG